MTALTEFLFPKPARRTLGGIVGWWESRRPQYNLIVGASGLFSLGLLRFLAWLPPNPRVLGATDWRVVLAFGLLANVCYLLGPMVETGIEKLSGGKILPTGPVLFRMGLTFSLGLTLLPALLAGLDWIFRIFDLFF
ncbi:hypothetical protein ACFL3S_08155 [Gemmatimonadota bacterium]